MIESFQSYHLPILASQLQYDQFVNCKFVSSSENCKCNLDPVCFRRDFLVTGEQHRQWNLHLHNQNCVLLEIRCGLIFHKFSASNNVITAAEISLVFCGDRVISGGNSKCIIFCRISPEFNTQFRYCRIPLEELNVTMVAVRNVPHPSQSSLWRQCCIMTSHLSKDFRPTIMYWVHQKYHFHEIACQMHCARRIFKISPNGNFCMVAGKVQSFPIS